MSLDLQHLRALVLFYYKKDIARISDDTETLSLIADTMFLVKYLQHTQS